VVEDDDHGPGLRKMDDGVPGRRAQDLEISLDSAGRGNGIEN
jgi:hypothetical protein